MKEVIYFFRDGHVSHCLEYAPVNDARVAYLVRIMAITLPAFSIVNGDWYKLNNLRHDGDGWEPFYYQDLPDKIKLYRAITGEIENDFED